MSNSSLQQNAVLYATEGEKNDVFYRHPEDKVGVWSYYIVHHPAFYWAHLISCVLLMFLALIEKPAVIPIEEEYATVVCTFIIIMSTGPLGIQS